VTVERLRASLADRYRIERELGQGGMATVYLAQDLKHNRKVAIKVLKPELAAVLGADRFVQEIQTTAQLQHPHILPLFDSGEADGFLFYVMPYIEGETLRGKLNRETQLGIDEAVKITVEVADALAYAHEHGVIHRDIKPENILLHAGRPMVADFGIALALSAAAGGRMTETGLSLGTPHYMSPEQATADKDITGRSDIYSLASVLYEMLTGEPPHMGNSAQQIIMKIVTEDAQPVTRLRKSVPTNVTAAVAQGLEKLPADRFDSAKAFADALTNPSFTTLRVAPGTAPGTPPYRRPRVLAALAAAAALGLLAGWLVGGRGGDHGSVGPTDVVRAVLPLADSVMVTGIPSMRFAISPSGTRIAFVGRKDGVSQLWVRELGDESARPLPDTRDAVDPFFSPDGASVGFFSGTVFRGTGTQVSIKVVAFAGGGVRTIVPDSVVYYGGGSWGDDNRIYFTNANRGLESVSAAGGAVTQVAQVDSSLGATELDFPDVLPGSRHALVMLWRGSPGASHIGVVDLRSGRVTDLTPGSIGRYVAPGFLAIGTADGQVLVARFDPAKATLTSTPVPMLKGVQQEGTNGTVQFAVSATGTLLYQPTLGETGGLVWVSRDGKESPVDTSMHGTFLDPVISPDGVEFAVTKTSGSERQVWVKQLATGTFTRLTVDVANADRPAWAPDGRRVAFLATSGGVRTAFIRRADGSDSTQAVVASRPRLDEIAFAPSGRYTLLRTEGTGAGTRHLLVMENGVDTVPRVLIQSRFDHYSMVVSPDGHWLAYVSEESGSAEVYVRPFPNVDSARVPISVGGGIEPVWSRSRTELFFRGPRGEMFSAPVTIGAHFTHGTPKALFTLQDVVQDTYHRSYDVTADGKRFVMVTSGDQDAPSLNVIFNWRAELEHLTETAR
jgi:Tol biopolymer transport system component/tRNA A-37 threonylcarbamoyl transferase component Bud32